MSIHSLYSDMKKLVALILFLVSTSFAQFSATHRYVSLDSILARGTHIWLPDTTVFAKLRIGLTGNILTLAIVDGDTLEFQTGGVSYKAYRYTPSSSGGNPTKQAIVDSLNAANPAISTLTTQFRYSNTANDFFADSVKAGHLIANSTTEQLWLGYDVNNYLKTEVSNVGLATITAVGDSPKIALMGGNVGIGTTMPQSTLNVIGSIFIGGSGNALIFPDSTNQTTAATAFDPTKTVELYEEFVSGNHLNSGDLGALGWTIAKYEGSIQPRFTGTGDAGILGVVRLNSGTTANGYASIGLTNTAGNYNQWIAFNQPNLVLKFRIKNSFAAKLYVDNIFGLGSSLSATPQMTAGFRVNNAGNWMAVTNTGSSAFTETNTGIAQSTTVWHTFEIRNRMGGVAQVEFLIDNILVATHTTNIPSGANRQSFYVFAYSGTGDTTATGLDIDYFYMKVTGLSR